MTERIPWPHQVYAREEVHRRIADGARSLCLTSPTGGGKSDICANLLRDFVEQGHHCAVFTNRKLLTSQLSRSLNAAGIHLGVRAADFESWSDHNAPVQICSMQTEVSRVLMPRQRDMKRARSLEEAHADHKLFPATRVLVDEAHLNAGDRMTEILREYQTKHASVLIGITATPLGVSHLYDELVVAGTTSSLRECGALVPALCYEPMSFDLWKIRRTKSGLASQSELEDGVKAIWSQNVVGLIYEQWKRINPDGKPSLGMAPGVKESLGLAMEFASHGVNAAHIDAEGIFVDGKYTHTTAQSHRDELFARSKSGEVPMIWNRFVCREGIDLPWLECLSLATPIASLTSYVQVVGRVLRASPSTGKCAARIIDHGGSLNIHRSPNIDRDQDWIAYYHAGEDKLMKDRMEDARSQKPKEPEPITCPECGMLRRSGPKCPGCGFEHSKSVRKVIQHDGSLKLVEGDFFPKRRARSEPTTLTLWTKVFFSCKNAKIPKTFGQARRLFFERHKYWPPDNLPFMPRNSADWSRKINAVAWKDLISRDD